MAEKEIKLINWLRLAFTPGVGSITMLKLIQSFGSVENVYQQPMTILNNVVSKGVAQSILSDASLTAVETALNWQTQSDKRKLLTLESPEYPTELAQIAAPPMVLFAEGDIALLARKDKVAMVGTRHPTVQGVENAKMFARELSENNVCIVSGLAAGIDRYSHEGALMAEGSTIAVIGTGVDVQYPAGNKGLYREISEKGLILTEFPLGTRPLSQNFPQRNRIIVGLSRACLVVESAIDGGSMISAGYALEMGRDVMAIPGSIHNQMARGCHKLIKQGAKLIETAQDIFEELHFVSSGKKEEKQSASDTNDPVLLAMGFDPISLDSLGNKLNYDFGELCGKLLELELSGQIANCGGGKYQRVFK
ncbi:DNA-processing protein DprA [Aquella oligotrophica]|uniref:DNA-protecting protein DprA n=1 Tax=Aquella oligotrophica TaxID=2067065 RepID=A0A2I7N3U4_9NEIS|nr:DNA-processing protein DprA [Aquella oligotrophica]AUR51126.1 DNA-protecting protein DprA [Aquella oligotrophica]